MYSGMSEMQDGYKMFIFNFQVDFRERLKGHRYRRNRYRLERPFTCLQLASIRDNGETKDVDPEVTELCLKVESLRQELDTCRAELVKLQKQLTQSERLQKNTESYNEDLRKQVNQLSSEIHERKKKEKEKADRETQTEEYIWTEADYYNYYGNYGQNPEATESQENVSTAGLDAANISKAAEDLTSNGGASDETVQPDSNNTSKAEEGDGGSIADILRATAEEAMTQTGFVFDETSGMYYDHSTGFYYDSASQLYYDANTGIYYYYDAESGRYQFHSRIEVPTTQTTVEPCQDNKAAEKKGRTGKKGTKKSSHQDEKVQELPKLLANMKISSYWNTASLENVRSDSTKLEEEEIEWVEKQLPKKSNKSRKQKQRSRSPDAAPRRKHTSKSHQDSTKSSSKRKRQKNNSHSPDSGKSKEKSKSEKCKKKKNCRKYSDDSEGNSEPEEGEITESEGEKESILSSSSSSPSPPKDSTESGMETESPEVKDFWPPCVRVTVVRSPVLQVGTLFIITADSPATIGRKEDMDHAIRIPEMGVSKFHAKVFFDLSQQSYMLVDQGSQNGTVINGNRILSPKAKCEPLALTHGDEVKMGETVLSFHIHSGTDTCDGCEPGQVMAHLSKHRREERAGPTPAKEDKEALRQKELKQMKAKYGLQSSEYEEAKALRNPKYKDRAESRRQTVGSEGVFQRDDAPSSVHVEISEVNKGRKMLEKMGWKKGEGLGKDGSGMKDPIELKVRKSQSGLGAGTTMSVEHNSLTRLKTQKNWEKARERFADSCQADVSLKTHKDRSPRSWVRAEETEAKATLTVFDSDNQTAPTNTD